MLMEFLAHEQEATGVVINSFVAVILASESVLR